MWELLLRRQGRKVKLWGWAVFVGWRGGELAKLATARRNERKFHDRSFRFDETVRRTDGGIEHFVHGAPRRNCRFARTQRRGQEHDHANPVVLSAGNFGQRTGGGPGRVQGIGRSAAADWLYAGEQSAAPG